MRGDHGQMGEGVRSPHFFKIILHGTIRSGKLVVPKRFVREYGTDLARFDVVLLKVPTGDTWDIELRRGDNGAVRLQTGWLDFANFYSLRYGHFLVFQYVTRGSNMFNVTVFDKTATEVEYPVRSQVTLNPASVEDTDEDDDCNVVESVPQVPRTSPMNATSRTAGSSMSNKNRVPLLGKQRDEALQRAKSFTSSNPYFPVVMQPHYVYRPYRLSVPGSFWQKYMGRKQLGEVKLRVSGDKPWRVRYSIREYKHQVRCKIHAGWKAFVVGNNLALGDVCVFELIRGLKSVSFKVTIFRAPSRLADSSFLNLEAPGNETARSKLEECSGAESTDEENSSSLRVTKANKINKKITRSFQPKPALFVSKHPFFQVVMSKCNISSWILNIPSRFTRQHINMQLKEQIVTLKIGDQSWPTKVVICRRRSSKATFSGGFSTFGKWNSLKVGDLCTFELIHREAMVFRVSIQRNG